jgi:Rieske Fe-S protein
MTHDQARDTDQHEDSGTVNAVDRRGFLSKTSNAAMAGGLVAGYGTFAVMAGQFLYPSGPSAVGWQLVTTLDRLRVGESIDYTAPSGIQVVVARQGDGNGADDFIALSSVCPHLGCQVHWEAQNNRFLCPCHNGAFDAQGRATQGPPAKSKQRLVQFPIAVEGNLLFVEVPLTSVT